MSYPWTQAHYWWRSLFPTWSDWDIKVGNLRVSITGIETDADDKQKVAKPSTRSSSRTLLLALLCVGFLGIAQSNSTGVVSLAQIKEYFTGVISKLSRK